jgi:15-cis-phytoene synthase
MGIRSTVTSRKPRIESGAPQVAGSHANDEMRMSGSSERREHHQIATGADARYCRDFARREAANFYWGFVLLPKAQRTAIYALYSFAREVDDHVDLNGRAVSTASLDASAGGDVLTTRNAQRTTHNSQPTTDEQRTTNNEQRIHFAHHRERLRRCFDGSAEDPVMRMLSEIVSQYGIPQSDLDGLIEGVEMDLRVTRYATWDDVQRYCSLVASTIGRMCVRVFGFTDPAALAYADDLGVAMQLTNILRDVREDARMGRVYLPQEELRSFGVAEAALESGEHVEEWEALARFEIARAHQYFERGLQVTTLIPRRAAACVHTMAGIYQALLHEIERDPYLPLRGRASLKGKDKLAVMLRSWLRVA